MGRKRIHPKKIDGLKIKKAEEKPSPEPDWTYGYTVTMTDGFGQYRDLKGAVDATGSTEVVKHIEGKVPDGWRLVKLVVFSSGRLVV